MSKASKFIKSVPARPATLKFKNGCRLKWVDTSYDCYSKVVRLGGVWFYISTSKSEQDDGCFAGEETGSSDGVYAAEVLQGLWKEF